MASYSTLRDGLKSRLATISGLKAHDTIPDEIQVPAAVVIPDSPLVTYDSTFGGGARWHFVIRLYVQRNSDYGSQDELDAFIDDSGGNSIKGAVEGAAIAGVDWAVVASAENYGTASVGDVEYLVCEFKAEIQTS